MTPRIPLRLMLPLLAGVLLAPSARAAHVSMSGDTLDLATPCTGEVQILVDPSMKEGATLDSSGTSQITMQSGTQGADSRMSISTKACAPNSRIKISVAPSTGVSIHDSHDTHFIMTGKLASLDASLDSNTTEIENTQSLDLSISGSATVHIASLERAAQIVASGTSSLTADSAQLTALSAQLTNNAALSISSGSIDALTVVTADNASANILGNASVATVTANGTGNVNIERVSGPIVRSGNGAVRVGAPNGEVYRPTPQQPSTPQNPAPQNQPSQSQPSQNQPPPNQPSPDRTPAPQQPQAEAIQTAPETPQPGPQQPASPQPQPPTSAQPTITQPNSPDTTPAPAQPAQPAAPQVPQPQNSPSQTTPPQQGN